MVPVLFLLGLLLVGWGLYVLVTGDFVATLDIAAGLVGTGVGVIALGAVVRSLEKIAGQLAERAGSVPARIAEPDAAPRRAPPAPAPTYRPETPPAAPVIVREGTIEGHHYRFYSDGSIEAEGPRGLRRYRSIDEAREQILRERSEAGAEPEMRQARKPEAARPRPPAPPQISPSDEDYAPKPQRKPGPEANDPYVPRYVVPPPAPPKPPAAEDDEWSEPFRMLLRGEPGPVAKPDKR